MRIALCQINPTIAAFESNLRAIIAAGTEAADRGASCAIFSELALCGYPPRDLLRSAAFLREAEEALHGVVQAIPEGMTWILGSVGLPNLPDAVARVVDGRALPHNRAYVLARGVVQAFVDKQRLPNYDVFDEARYFEAGGPSAPLRFSTLGPGFGAPATFDATPASSQEPSLPAGGRDLRLGLTVCEDAWHAVPMQGHAQRHGCDPVGHLVAEGIDLLVNLSASPYGVRKQAARADMFARIAARHRCPTLFVNQVGGQDELIFDGASAAWDAEGRRRVSLPSFVEGVACVELSLDRAEETNEGEACAMVSSAMVSRATASRAAASGAAASGAAASMTEQRCTTDDAASGVGRRIVLSDPGLSVVGASAAAAAPWFAGSGLPGAELSSEGGMQAQVTQAQVTQDEVVPLGGGMTPLEGMLTWSEASQLLDALTVGVRDYLRKTGITGAIVGLSGGIDSAVTCAVAVRALGRDKVMGVALPSRYSSSGSLDDAQALADALGIALHRLPIEVAHVAMESMLSATLAVSEKKEQGASDVTWENVQSRIRGLALMALSNRSGFAVLGTGNKCEFATGYSTMYGDAIGAISVLGDLVKHRVYALAHAINREAGRRVIPHATIDKAPSAELRPDQRDADSLPPYTVLDVLVEAMVERGEEAATLVAAGYDAAVVERVAGMIGRAEYKRRQAPFVLITTAKAFGSGRRMPIAAKPSPA